MEQKKSEIKLLIFVLLLLFVVAAFTGCSQLTVQQEQLDPKVYYNHDLEMNVNGVEAIGITVAPKADIYTIKVEDRANVDQLIISTCKRTEVVKKESGGFFKRKQGFVYVYVPGLMEKVAGCRVELTGLDSNNNKTAFGIVAFEHEDFQLKAGISCNSIPDYNANGVGVCEAAKGQYMQIWFKEPVRTADESQVDKCKLKDTEGLSFQIRLAPRECTYVFRTIKAPYQMFNLTALGDEQVLLRGD